jgi:hypothetical protein
MADNIGHRFVATTILAVGGEGEAQNNLLSGAESDILKGVDRNSISSPIEAGERGRPSAILHLGGIELSARQQAILDKLPNTTDEWIVKKSDVSMMDLAALSAATGDEFAMFTKKGDRLVVRGDGEHVYIGDTRAKELSADGYRFSGHTHTKLYHNGMELTASDGDYGILKYFGQKESVIYNVKGEYRTFENLLREGLADG